MATLDEKMALREALLDLGYTRTKGGLIIEALISRKHQPEAAVIQAQKRKARKSWKKE